MSNMPKRLWNPILPTNFSMPPGIVTFNVEGISLPFMAGTAPDPGTTVVPKDGPKPALQRREDLLRNSFKNKEGGAPFLSL